MVDPQTTSAIDVAYKVILADRPSLAGRTFMGFTPGTAPEGIVLELTEDSGTYQATFNAGTTVEQPIVEIGIRGLPADYKSPRNEAIRLRFLLSQVQNYVLNDITVLAFEPVDGIFYLGRDEQKRVMFTLRFKAHMETNYA